MDWPLSEFSASGTAEAVQEASTIFRVLSTEMYYGLNVQMVLAEATPEERAAVARIVLRAEIVRRKISESRRKAEPPPTDSPDSVNP